MDFSSQLAPLVAKVGGAEKAATLCGVTRQSIYRWLRGGPMKAITATAVIMTLQTAAKEIARVKTPSRGVAKTTP